MGRPPSRDRLGCFLSLLYQFQHFFFVITSYIVKTYSVIRYASSRKRERSKILYGFLCHALCWTRNALSYAAVRS